MDCFSVGLDRVARDIMSRINNLYGDYQHADMRRRVDILNEIVFLATIAQTVNSYADLAEKMGSVDE